MVIQEMNTMDIASAQANVWERLSQIGNSNQIGSAYLFSAFLIFDRNCLISAFKELIA
ncbi:hypothetical protein OAR31_04040 [Candidatus Marinimicrobia bacterium]|nr:hypothetical protein [Candidatus Neomarinimicrobiota bacterium]